MSLAEIPWLLAFAMGLLSGLSLPLGTLTTWVWTPSDRVVAVLMAFGGGALLAALTIDLVASALARGHFFELAVGCVIGGLLFRLLNEIINNQGGFLRKSSTVILYLQRRRRERFKHALGHLGRTELFAGLPPETIEDLAGSAFTVEAKRGESIYRQHDPSERLYVVEKGRVELRDPTRGMAPTQVLGPGDCFGHLGVLTGSPRAMFAVAREDVRLSVIPKPDLVAAASACRDLSDRIVDFAQSGEVATYLTNHHGLSEAAYRHWCDETVQNLARGEPIPDAVGPERPGDGFFAVSDHVGRFPLFTELPEIELEAVAARLICKSHARGETLFHQNETADRLYIVDRGEVSLIDPREPSRRPTIVGDHEAFGGFSFLTGARHSVTALVTEDTVLWVLRKRDFDDLLGRCPVLGARVREFLQRDDIARYLEDRLAIDANRAAQWTRKAVRSLDSGKLIPSAGEMSRAVTEHAGAPLAIWLGILLDGIPEALVIGASLIGGSHVSYSLIAGLFLSNYPEALSSSVGMRHQGMSFRRVLFMWTSLMVLTGVFAALGNVFLEGAPPGLFALVEGIAAGAMLTMIAETMLPEAYFKGGSVVGLSTLGGFLVAIFFTTLH